LLDSFVAAGQRGVAIRQHVEFWHAGCQESGMNQGRFWSNFPLAGGTGGRIEGSIS